MQRYGSVGMKDDYKNSWNVVFCNARKKAL